MILLSTAVVGRPGKGYEAEDVLLEEAHSKFGLT